jgi:hypothetical protein
LVPAAQCDILEARSRIEVTMTCGMVSSVAAVLMLAGPGAMAGSRKPSPPDAARQLAEALKSGTADAQTIAAIVGWVLAEKPEKVAPGLAAALQAAADEAATGTADPRGGAVARGAVDLFAGLLDDARTHRRRDPASLADELAPLLRTARPALNDALAEVLRRPSPPLPR